MEDLEDNVSSSGFESLFIQEESGEQDRALVGERVEYHARQSELTFTGTQLNPSASIQPLREMDDLLKSCEELIGVPFGSHFSPSYTETSLSRSTQAQLNERVRMDTYGETSTSPQPYLSTTYIDTRIDKAETETQDQQQQAMGSIVEGRGRTTAGPSQREMPLTSAGTELSGTMVEYQGQLLGMLAMLESCMEEAGMDFDPQEWAADTNQEYVHVRQNHSLHKATTLGPMEQGRTVWLETQPAPLQSLGSQAVDGATERSSMEDRDGVTMDSTTQGSPEKPWLSCEDVGTGRLDRSGTETGVCVNFQVDQRVLEPQFTLSGLSMPMENTQNESGNSEEMHTRYMSAVEGTHTSGDLSRMDIGDTGLPAEGRPELNMEVIDLRSGVDELGALASKLEECIEEVQRLERNREELLEEVLVLRGQKDREDKEARGEAEERIEGKVSELMEMLKREAEVRGEERQRDVQSLREQRAEEERRMWKVNLERQGLQEETRRLKRRLFTIARDCAHNQAALATQQHEVELFKREEEKLQSLVLQLTEEGSQLRSAQQHQLSSLKAHLHAQGSSQTLSTQEELTRTKRNSCGDIQQYLQGGLKALEDRFEPVLLTLLKRRDATAGALLKAREQAQELKAQIGPLREESQKLGLQRVCLEERIKLMHIQRREDTELYKATVYCLEENSRVLKTELKFQKKKTKEMEELKDSLTKQLLLYRAAIEDHNKCDHNEEKT